MNILGTKRKNKLNAFTSLSKTMKRPKPVPFKKFIFRFGECLGSLF